MEEPDFDDDDLINDYIDEEPMPDYDDFDEMIEEMAGQNQESTTPVETIMGEPSQSGANDVDVNYSNQQNNDRDIPSSTPSQNRLETATSNEMDDPANVREYISRHSEQQDLYTFEMYTRHSKWRTDPLTDSRTMKAHEWKTKLSLSKRREITNSAKTRQAVAPESQLLALLQRRSASTQRISLNKRKAAGIYLYPKEGQTTTSMTLGDGNRIYVKHCSDRVEITPKNRLSTTCLPLGVSMTDLIRRVDNQRRRAIHAKLRSTARISETTSDSKEKEQLWVDKHAPRSVSHLLSDERTNREVLRALRAWDPYVFGRDPPARPNMGNKEESNPSETKASQQNQSSHDKRPDENNRVILLAGPPGVGKTTLAHLVARHAGYRPMEVNGSDERSASTLTNRIRQAMESTASWGNLTSTTKTNKDLGRPNCLILDEIDGADAKGAIASIVEFIKAEIPPKGKKSKRASSGYIRRPIIFICNHKHAPTLRPLLPFARCFHVHPPSPTRLIARLKAVLNAQKLTVLKGTSLLHQLVVSSGGDIRSCLYTLQFASAEVMGTKDISAPLEASLRGRGLKDDRNDVAGTITTVFRKTKQQRFSGFKTSSSIATRNAGDRSGSVSRVLDSVDAFGDDSKTLNVLFLNLPRVSYIDPTLDRCAAAHEWLSGADLYRSNKISINSQMEHYVLQRLHIPSAAAAIHLLCRVELRPNLTFSTRELSDENYQKQANFGMIQKFLHGMPTKARSSSGSLDVVGTETIPLSLWILSAGDGASSLDRAASSIDVLTNREKASFDSHVAALRSLGLTYTLDQEGQPDLADSNGPMMNRHLAVQMRLEPPIERLVQYRDLAQQRRTIPQAMKELLARHVLLEGLRKKDEHSDKDREQLSDKGSPIAETKSAENYTKKAPRKLENMAMSISPPQKRKKTSPTSVASDFLGIGAKKAKAAKSARKAAMVGLVGSKKTKTAHSGSGLPLSQVIRLRYVKGFTQAVRTPARLSDLE